MTTQDFFGQLKPVTPHPKPGYADLCQTCQRRVVKDCEAPGRRCLECAWNVNVFVHLTGINLQGEDTGDCNFPVVFFCEVQTTDGIPDLQVTSLDGTLEAVIRSQVCSHYLDINPEPSIWKSTESIHVTCPHCGRELVIPPSTPSEPSLEGENPQSLGE